MLMVSIVLSKLLLRQKVPLLQTGAMASLMGGRRPRDEEAALYDPMLTIQETNERTSYTTPQEAFEWRENHGKRSCDCCGNLQQKVSRCSRCQRAFYCSQKCQKADWGPRHKHICNKSKEEMQEKLLAEGLLRRMGNGDLAMCPRPW